MFIFLKEIAIIAVSVFTAILVSLGAVPQQAVAPDVTVPTPISGTNAVVEEQKSGTLKNNTLATSTGAVATGEVEAQQSAPANPAPQKTKSPSEAKPLIDDFEKSLQEALDALAKIQQSSENTDASSDLNATVRGAVVNILCTTAGGGALNPISASGVVIDQRGIIMTNAHVAQYLLLKNYPSPGSIQCIARTGSPAQPAYTLDLLFISPSWIANNAQKIDDAKPTGNGEHDYAFLAVTGFTAAPDVPVPAQFPSLPLIASSPRIGNEVLLAGYPAGFLGGITIQKELYAVSAPARIQQLYTFGTVNADLFSIGGSIVAQQGSSGGAVAVANAKSPSGAALLGLIVTSSDATNTAGRDLRALSTEYIIRDFESERGIPLADYLGSDLLQEKALFELNTKPTLSAALINVLEQ